MTRLLVRLVLFLGFWTFSMAQAEFGVPSAKDGWVLNKERDGIKLYTRPIAGAPIPEVRGIAREAVRIEEVFQVLNDLPAYQQWVSYLAVSKVVDHPSPDLYYVYHRYDLPWPLSDRDILVRVLVDRDYENGMLSATMEAIGDTMLHPICSGCVRIPFMQGDIRLRYISRDSTEGYFTERVNLGGSVPRWLNDLIGREMPFVILANLRAESRNPKYAQKALSSPEKKGFENAIRQGKLDP